MPDGISNKSYTGGFNINCLKTEPHPGNISVLKKKQEGCTSSVVVMLAPPTE